MKEIVERSSGFWVVGPSGVESGPFLTLKEANKACKPKNECGKTRKVNEPYEVWRNDSGWEWRVLKKWQAPDKEPTSRLASPKVAYARWFCAVKSPMTHGSYDLGDVYVLDVIRNGVRIDNPTLETW